MDISSTSSTTAVQVMQGLNSDAVKGKAVSALGEAAKSRDMKRIEQSAEEFEAVFLSEMLKPMFEMTEVDETFGGGKGEEVFRGLMVQEYGKMIAKQGGIGLASHVKAELIKMQGGHDLQTAKQIPDS